jgi:hypothetical protein
MEITAMSKDQSSNPVEHVANEAASVGMGVIEGLVGIFTGNSGGSDSSNNSSSSNSSSK